MLQSSPWLLQIRQYKVNYKHENCWPAIMSNTLTQTVSSLRSTLPLSPAKGSLSPAWQHLMTHTLLSTCRHLHDYLSLRYSQSLFSPFIVVHLLLLIPKRLTKAFQAVAPATQPSSGFSIISTRALRHYYASLLRLLLPVMKVSSFISCLKQLYVFPTRVALRTQFAPQQIL